MVGAPIGSVGCAVEAEFCEQRALPGYAGRRFPLARIGWAVGRGDGVEAARGPAEAGCQ